MIPEDRRREAARVKNRGGSAQQVAVLAFAVSALLVLLLF